MNFNTINALNLFRKLHHVLSATIKYIFLLLLLNSCFFAFSSNENKQANNPQKAKELLDLSENFINQNLDSALSYAFSAQKTLSKISTIDLNVRCYNNLGDIFKLKGDIAKSINYYFKSKEIIDKDNSSNRSKINLLKFDVFIKIGSLYLQVKKYDESLFYYKEALDLIEKSKDKIDTIDKETRKLKVYNNIAAVYMQKADYETALMYLKNGVESNKLVKNKMIEATLSNNIGICYLEKKDYSLANHYFLTALQIRKELNDKKGQAQVLNNIGKNEVYKANFVEAANFFKNALNISSEIGNNESAIISLESLSYVYDTLSDYKNALYYFKAFKKLNDKIYNLETKSALNSLEQRYKLENQQKKYELKLQRKESENLKANYNVLKLLAALMLLVLITSLVIITLRSKVKNSRLQEEKIKLEQEKLILEHLTLKESLEFKEKELTANALNLLKNNELIQKITDKLIEVKRNSNKENQQHIQSIIQELKNSQNNSMWEEFETHFTKVHSHFYDTLQSRFPTLTANEKKLCAFIRLNLSTKDISQITQQSINSITVARSRLRKKLNIEGEDIHLVNFLSEI